MHTVDISIHCIAQTRMNLGEVDNWMQRIDVKKPLSYGVEDSAMLCSLCGKRCYMSFEVGLNPNVTKVRWDIYEHVRSMMASGHGSVLEHATWTFAIEGVSRVFTGEMNRHRVGVAISEGSMRYIRFSDIGFWMPTSLDPKDGDSEETKKRKAETKNILRESFAEMEERYAFLCDLWDIDSLGFGAKKKLTSVFRRLIGMGVATGGVWTINARALLHIAALRTSPAAEEEICLVLTKIMKYLEEDAPCIFEGWRA